MARKASDVVPQNTNTAVLDIQAQLRQMAAEASETVTSGTGSMQLRTTGKVFTTPDGKVHQGPLECVILDYTSRNTYYKEGYQTGKYAPPVCFATAQRPKDMVPSEKATEPQAQSCESCPHNQFGSGGGNRKACKNARVLAIVPVDAGPEVPVMLLQVSPKAISRWDKHVMQLASKGLVPVAIVTRINFDAGVAYPVLTFEIAGPNLNLDVDFARMNEAKALLNQSRVEEHEDDANGNGITPPIAGAAAGRSRRATV